MNNFFWAKDFTINSVIWVVDRININVRRVAYSVWAAKYQLLQRSIISISGDNIGISQKAHLNNCVLYQFIGCCMFIWFNADNVICPVCLAVHIYEITFCTIAAFLSEWKSGYT